MKKKVLFVAACFVASLGISQDLVSKKGEPYMPEAGDYAIGFGASSFLEYFGNMFNSGANSAPVANWLDSGMTIWGKQFIDANTANRAMVRIGFGSDKTTTSVTDVTDPDNMVEDVTSMGAMNILLGVGREMRRGNTRLQGVYGAMVGLGLSSTSTTNEFGNALDDIGVPDSRLLESKSGMGLAFGLNGFVGFEYFVIPKVSIGAEYMWGLWFITQAAGEQTVESFDGSDVTEETIDGTVKTSSFWLDTGLGGESPHNYDQMWGGAHLRAIFHF